MKYRTLAAALLLGSVMFTSCVDEFSELNSDPSTITKPDIRFLFTKCEASFQPGDYAQWFGGFNDLSTWSQTTVSSGGNTTRSNRPTDEANGCGYEVNEVLRYANEIRYQISQLPEEVKATYEYIQYFVAFVGLRKYPWVSACRRRYAVERVIPQTCCIRAQVILR